MSRQLLLKELEDLMLSDEVIAKCAIQQLKMVFAEVEHELGEEISYGELKDLYVSCIGPLTRQIATEEADKVYTDDELIALISFYKVNPWVVEKAAMHQLQTNTRLTDETTSTINNWWTDKRPEIVKNRDAKLRGEAL